MKNSIIYLAIFAILLLVLGMQQCRIRNYKNDIKSKEGNYLALKDTITQTTNKLKQIQFEKSVLVTSKQGLKDLDENLLDEINAQKGKVAYLSKIISTLSTVHTEESITVIHDTLQNPCDSIAFYELPWKSYKNYDSINSRKISGITKFSMNKGFISSASSIINEDIVNFDIITGLEKKTDHYEIFIRSNYPGFKPSKIDGAFIPQKDLMPVTAKKKWSFGPTINAGLGASKINNSYQPVIYFGIGLGVTYKLISF